MNGTRPVSPEPRASNSTSAIAPVPERAAAVILGSMIALILILMAILVQTTWVDPARAADAPAVETPGYAQR